MNRKQQKTNKIAVTVAMIGGGLVSVSLILLFVVMLNYNELLVVLAYNFAYIAVLLGLGALALTVSVLGLKNVSTNGNQVLASKSGRLGLAIIIASFVVIAFARAEVFNYEVETGIRNDDGTVKTLE